MMSNMTPRKLAELITIVAKDGLSQTGVVERMGIDRSTLADIVRRLSPAWESKRNLLRRMLYCSLTPRLLNRNGKECHLLTRALQQNPCTGCKHAS